MPATKSVEQLQKLTASQPRNAAAWHELGNALLDEGKVDRAISMFRRALRIDDSLAEVHNDLGTAYFSKGWHTEAEACFRKAITARPDHGVAHANLGAALRAQRKLGDSRRAFQDALLLKLHSLIPAFLRAGFALAPAARREEGAGSGAELDALRRALTEENASAALELARQALARAPEDPEVLNLCALAWEAGKDIEGALAHARAALARRPDVTEYHITLASCLVKAGDLDGAMQTALRALKLEPGSAAVHATIAGIFHPWREDLAEDAARRAIELDPTYDAGHGTLAAALWGQSRLEEAERSAREAIRLQPARIIYRTNLAMIVKDLGRLDEARALYQDLAARAPRHGKVCVDLGALALESEGDLASARAWFRKAQLVGDDPRAGMAEALVDFMDERFETGWDTYEARKRVSDQRGQHDRFAMVPDWDGKPLEQDRLLVYGEQGLGDEVMFASMFGDLAQRQPGALVLCEPRLAALFARSFPSLEVIGEPRETQRARVEGTPGIRRKVAAGSLGRYFRRRKKDFPDHRGYLMPDPAKVAAWRERLNALGAGVNVGVSWIGGVQKTGRGRRSLTLEQLRPVLVQPSAQWVSLQYTPASEEIAEFRKASGVSLHEFPGVTNDMDELASLIDALDLVISVCNTTVHVAGAIGKEVLVLAPFVPEWRYGIVGEHMVWYPSARVFRQHAYWHWEQVVDRVRGELATRLAARGAVLVADQQPAP